MKVRQFLLLVLLALPMLVVCSVQGSGKPIPPPPSDFAVGATIPGWIQEDPHAGRGEVAATGVHAGGRWSVLLSRKMKPRPRDLHMSIAVMDDGVAHAGKASVRFTADPTALPFAETIVCREVPRGLIVPDGVMSSNEWPPGVASFVPLSPQDDLPAGRHPPTATGFVLSAAAYDEEYVYFVFQWTDQSSTASELGPQLQWTGSSWAPRPHQANDVNGNGVLDPGETVAFSAAAEDEDRLALFFPIHDGAGAYQTGATGCAVSCHQNLALDPSGAEAVHAWQLPDDRTDVWVWRAASTAAARIADDLVLGFGNAALGKSGGGSGFSADPGTSAFVAQDPQNPGFMFSAPPGGHAFLVAGTLDFGPATVPSFPVIPSVPNTAAPYVQSDFNATGLPPETWTGQFPFFANNFLPPFVQRMATDGRADVETGSTFSANKWTVEFRRRRITRDPSGAVRTDDVQFDEDAPFRKAAFDVTTAALGLPFSVAVTDHAAGHGTRETRYQGPLLLSRDESLAGPVLASDLILHDYGSGFMPASAADFTDPRETRPDPSAGNDVHLSLKAGTDGGETLFVLAEWDDPTADQSRDLWTFDGFFWTQSGFEDELRLLWNATAPRDAFIGGGGCAYLCHSAGGPFGAPAAQHFSTAAINEVADVWRWMAGRGGTISVADDETADWRFFDRVEAGSPNAALHGDEGRSPFITNADPSRDFPLFMAENDPNANALFLTLTGTPLAIPFLDVLGNRPPAPSGGGGGVSYANQIHPIFTMYCMACHPPLGNLDLQTYAGILAGGSSGLVVIPGNPSASLIIKRLTGQIQPQMPFGAPPLSAENIQLVSDWIAAGAPNN